MAQCSESGCGAAQPNGRWRFGWGLAEAREATARAARNMDFAGANIVMVSEYTKLKMLVDEKEGKNGKEGVAVGSCLPSS